MKLKTKISSFILALILLMDMFTLAPTPISAAVDGDKSSTTSTIQNQGDNENYIKGMVKITCDGSNQVSLNKGEKLYAFTTLDSSLEQNAMYSWQIMTEGGKWATISGYVFYYAVISEALLFNAETDNGAAYMRCIVTVGDKKYISDVLTILPSLSSPEAAVVSDSDVEQIEPISAPALFSMRTASEEPVVVADGNTSAEAFQIVINYTYRHANAALPIDKTTAANTFTVTLPKNSYYTGTVATPPEIGYLPYVKLDQASYVAGTPLDSDYITYDGENYVLANLIEFNNQTQNITINVYFIPQIVTYRVKIYEQNLFDDEYTLAETITKTGIANSAVGEGHDTPRVGFSPLFYDDKTSIDEDGSFAIDIYYDRIYYLVDLDMNDNNDAFGAVNHYVRYQSTVVLPPPTRPGYSFINWTLTSVKVDREKNETVTEHSYPYEAEGGYIIYSVEHNLTYIANWKVGKTSYTVIYWLENPDDYSFTLDSFKVVTDVTPGDVVSAKDDLAISDASCFTFNAQLSDKNVVVSSDGTTAINAYYLRKYYTMTFTGESVCVIEPHTHTNACPKGNCTLENHTHTSECGNSKLVCDMTEHIHEGSCCTITEHAHDSSCCSVPYHVHGTGASSDCTKPEHPLHHDTCYSRDTLKEATSLTDNNQKTAYNTLSQSIEGPINGYVYRIRIKKNSTIYNFLYVHNKWFYLGTANNYNGVSASGIKNPDSAANSISSAKATPICEYEVHTHGDGNCTCPITEHDHTTGCTCEITRHVHGEGDCNYTICGMEQHRHVIDCYEHLCGKVAHTHNATCVRECQQIEHSHTDSCQTKKSQNFLKFNAKYNSDISLNWRSVWSKFTNGERWKANTYFSQVLVYLPFMPPTSITFTSDKGSADKIYNINYYLESLGNTGTLYQNKYFDLNNTVNAKYNYLTPDEDFFDIPGFTQFASNPAFSGDQISTTNGGPVSLYYERNEYALEFVSLGTTLSTKTKNLKYQQPIGSSFELFAKDIPYPSNKESGAIQFVGWYTTPNCAQGTEFYFDGNTTMPIGGLVLYAKWEPCSYTVSIYSNVEKEKLLYNNTVLFDSFLEEPDYTLIQHPGGLPNGEHPGYGDEDHMIFAGWYYSVDGKEYRFDFNTMSVKFDMEIYAKWTSRIPVSFTVRYVYFDGNDYVDIAEPTTGASLAGLTKNFKAKVTTDLYDDYRVNFFPDVRSHSITMSSNEEENVFMFIYSTIDEVNYTVNHKFTDTVKDKNTGLTVFESILGVGNTTLNFSLSHTIKGESIKQQAASVAVSFREGITKANIVQAVNKQYGTNIDVNSTQATSLWNVITEMSPDYFIQDLILTTESENNVATFLWEDIGQQALYQIIYYQESIDGSEYLIYKTAMGKVNIGAKIDADKDGKIISIPYFEHDPTHPSTISNGIATETTVDPTTGLLAKGLVLKLYYKRNEYPYTVHYYKTGTTTPLSESIVSKAKYEQTISVESVAKEIPGYTLVNGSEEVEITAKDTQTIVCFYQGLEVYYQYQVMGMGATIVNIQESESDTESNINANTDTVAVGGRRPLSKKAELWGEGYFLNAWYYSVGDGEKIPVPQEWLSNNNTVISLPAPTEDYAGKTIYVFAEVLPTTRRFSVEGFATKENDPQAFVFRLEGKSGTPTANIDLTFVIFDIGYTDITGLPYGEYTLTTLHWAWRLGHPDNVIFNENELDAETGTVKLNLDTTGDVIINYSSVYFEKWLSDDASGVVPLYMSGSRGRP